MMVSETTNNYFSVIIPLYNKVEYIERAIRSILDQTYPYFEIIVVNDGSVDGGEKKVELFKDERIVLVNQTNQGVSAARNTGAKHAKYDYYAFLDGDDVWSETFLELANRLILQYPNAGIYGTNNYFEYPNGKIHFELYEDLFGRETSGIIKDYFGLFAQTGKSPFSNSNICIPKKIYEEFGGYKVGVTLTEDSDLWCRIALKYDIAFSTTPLATYFLDLPNNTFSKIQSENYQVSKTLQNCLDTMQVKPEYIRSVSRLIAFQQVSLVKRAILTGNHRIAIQKLMDKRVLLEYPTKFLFLLPLALLPHGFFHIFNRFIKKFK